jgi:hypothetical protein|tara:strand:- start:650 stop:1417 length:768 start_codon:yes stop_codon:yes gene_type:complete
MLKKLIHYGCSFGVGNGVPHYVAGLPGDVAPHLDKISEKKIISQYNFKPQEPTTCGKFLAENLRLEYKKVAQNGASNEMIFRKVLQANLDDAFVLIGFTSYNRREGLTTRRENSHWHTWKMLGPGESAKYKDLVFDPWKKEYKPAIEQELQIRTVIQIIYLQNYFKNKNVPYLMFNALWNGFDKPLTKECKSLLKSVDQNNFFKLHGKFDETQHGWCIRKGLSVSELDEHPNIQGQTQWGMELLPLAEKIINASR